MEGQHSLYSTISLLIPESAETTKSLSFPNALAPVNVPEWEAKDDATQQATKTTIAFA